jgi:hypothetical protein
MSQCDAECKTTTQQNTVKTAQQDCECPSQTFVNETCCPSEKAIQMWTKAFPEAIGAVQTDILKEKIKKAWGPLMEKEADAYVKSMGSFWESMMARGKARKALSEDFGKIFESYMK